MAPATIVTTKSAAHTPFPLMDLPAELRLRIYRSTIQVLIHDIRAEEFVTEISCALKPQRRYRGTLALLHAAGSVREECAREVLPTVQAERFRLEVENKNLLAAYHHSIRECLTSVRADLGPEVGKAAERVRTMRYVESMLSRCLETSGASFRYF